jgi:hypothetical protein
MRGFFIAGAPLICAALVHWRRCGLQKDRQTLPGKMCGGSVMMLWQAKVWYSTKLWPKLLWRAKFWLGNLWRENFLYDTICKYDSLYETQNYLLL